MYKVLVVTPAREAHGSAVFSSFSPPLSQGLDSVPLRLATVLKSDFLVRFLPIAQLFDNFTSIDKLLQFFESEILSIEPDVIIFSTDYHISNRSTAYFGSSLKMAKVAKKIKPKCVVLAAGKHSIVRPTDYFIGEQFGSGFDYVFTCEPEEIVCDFIHQVLQNLSVESYSGIAYKRIDERIVVNESDSVVEVNSLPPLDFSLLFPYVNQMLQRESLFGIKIPLTIRTSYGCPFECPFCAGTKTWKKYRTRSALEFLKDLEAYEDVSNYFELIFIDDEVFGADKNHAFEIIETLKSKGIRMLGYLTHTSFFTKELAERSSGAFHSVLFGAENFDDNVLGMMKSGQTYTKLREKSLLAKTFNLEVRLEYIIGLPQETLESAFLNVRRAMELIIEGVVDYISCYLLTIHPGTEFQINPDKYGIKILHHDFDHYHEAGDYPAFRTKNFSRSMIINYYNQFRTALREAREIKTTAIYTPIFSESTSNFETFKLYHLENGD